MVWSPKLKCKSSPTTSQMKGSPCCTGLMRSCLHTYRTKTNLTQHIIQPGGRGHQPSMGEGAISQVWGGHQPSMGGSSTNYGGGPSAKYGGVINQLWGGISQVWGAISQVWGGHQPTMGGPSAKYGGDIFPPVCTGSQNPENYFSNTYVLPSVNRTAGPIISYTLTEDHLPHSHKSFPILFQIISHTLTYHLPLPHKSSPTTHKEQNRRGYLQTKVPLNCVLMLRIISKHNEITCH